MGVRRELSSHTIEFEEKWGNTTDGWYVGADNRHYPDGSYTLAFYTRFSVKPYIMDKDSSHNNKIWVRAHITLLEKGVFASNTTAADGFNDVREIIWRPDYSSLPYGWSYNRITSDIPAAVEQLRSNCSYHDSATGIANVIIGGAGDNGARTAGYTRNASEGQSWDVDYIPNIQTDSQGRIIGGQQIILPLYAAGNASWPAGRPIPWDPQTVPSSDYMTYAITQPPSLVWDIAADPAVNYVPWAVKQNDWWSCNRGSKNNLLIKKNGSWTPGTNTALSDSYLDNIGLYRIGNDWKVSPVTGRES